MKGELNIVNVTGPQGFTGYTGFQGFQGTQGAGFQGPTGYQGLRGDDTDFQNLSSTSGEAAQTDLRNIGSGRIKFAGAIKLYSAKEAIQAGQPVCIDINTTNGNITVKAYTSLTTSTDIVGVAIQRAVNPGDKVEVVSRGYTTARFYEGTGGSPNIDDTLYLSTNDYTKVDIVGTEKIGFLASTKLDSGAYIRLIDFSVTDAAQQGPRGHQGVAGVDGPQGFTGFQGNTLSWWHSYKFNYDTALTGTPGSGNAQRLLHPSAPFSIDESNKDDFSLLRLVSLGVLKELDTPSTGYTTYTMLMDISMNCVKNIRTRKI